MTARIEAPFFEIGPKNLLRRGEIAAIAQVAGAAGREHGVTVLLTVPTAMIAPIAELDTGVLVLAQGMSLEPLGPSMDVVTAESLVDADAAGVMLGHDASPLDDDQLAAAIRLAQALGLATVACAGSEAEAAKRAAMGPEVVLFEPPDLIGAADATGERPWIPAATAAIHAAAAGGRRTLAMHAGGVATPAIAEAIMRAGADGTGSTSGVLQAADPSAAAREFIAATRAGWDAARDAAAASSPTPTTFTTAAFTKETP